MKNYLILCFIICNSWVHAQLSVGASAADPSAQLDVTATDKGILIPRVALTGTSDTTTIANGNETSLLVYNTATAGDIAPGYHYWDGTKWQRLATMDNVEDEVNSRGGGTSTTDFRVFSGTSTTLMQEDEVIYFDTTGTSTLELGSAAGNEGREIHLYCRVFFFNGGTSVRSNCACTSTSGSTIIQMGEGRSYGNRYSNIGAVLILIYSDGQDWYISTR